MGREVICDCLPWLGLLLASCAGLWLMVRLNEGRWDLRRLVTLHGNESGTAQSLSFVLTLPFFVVIVLFIVQVSQLMIATMVVHYAAFAGARAAVVWIPAGIGSRTNWMIAQNCVGGQGYAPDDSAPEQVYPDLLQPTVGGLTYLAWPNPALPKGPKYDKVRAAAWLACLPICPSRDVGAPLPAEGTVAHAILKDVYQTLAQTSPHARLKHKLAYAMNYTDVEVRFYHGNSGGMEPPLVPWFTHCSGSKDPVPGDDEGFQEFFMGQEVGWQDPITVTVTHYLALLPGPGRILANKVGFLKLGQAPPDRVQQRIEADTLDAGPPGNTHVYKLQASCTLGNEGAKSVMPYEYQPY